MRARRVRFTVSRVRSPQSRATKTLEGVTSFRNNIQGRYARFEAIANQRSAQNSLCYRCGEFLPLDEAGFESREFTEGATNPVVHKRKCT